jgi:Fic-DOC domain mobile mystery protein B
MSDPFEPAEDATPLTPSERSGLILSHVTTRGELNELEQRNILAADRWAFERRRDVLSEPFLRNLHRRMFGQVWRWAGKYRTSERNLGIASYRIETELRQLLDDIRYGIAHESHAPDEMAVRFHHRLVSIHPFPNGNGRWSRLSADLMAVRLGQPRFGWGSTNLQTTGDVRRRYIEALRAADNHNIAPLLTFARS